MTIVYPLDLEKIKEFNEPINALQTHYYQMKKLTRELIEYKDVLRFDSANDKLSDQIDILIEAIKELEKRISELSNSNMLQSLFFYDNLIKKYKDLYKNQLLELHVNENVAKSIGLFLIENQKVNKTLKSLSFIFSIKQNQWIKLLDSLKENTLFIQSINKLSIFYEDLVQKKLNKILLKIPPHIDKILIENFKNQFLYDPSITFEEYLTSIQSAEDKEDLREKRELIKKAKKREEYEELKRKQEEEKELYDDYLRLSDTEFERRQRRKKREKLKEIDVSKKTQDELELSDEVSEKIAKFKSQFEKKFEFESLIHENDDKDPLSLVRTRKKKKDKEYKEFKEHFDSVD